MINRVLIRIKVVQILYSYLLVEKKFTLEEPPATPTKEKRYAYGLYTDMLALMVLISREMGTRRKGALANTRFMERVEEDDRVRSAVRRLERDGTFCAIASRIAEGLKDQGVFRNYIKDIDRGDPAAEDTFWREEFNQVIAPDAGVQAYARGLEGYTLKGYERMTEMMNGTLTNFSASQDSLPEGLRTLAKSLDKARELYFRLLALAVDITALQARKLDSNRHKFLKTAEDLNPNMKFVDNAAVIALRNYSAYRDYVEENHINWLAEDPLLLENLLKSVVESDIYREYMESPERGMAADAELWRELFKKVILVNGNFLEALEDSSVFWNDDLDIMGTFVMKTFRRIEEGVANPILEKYKDEEDARFGSELMKYVFKGKDRYQEWIREAVRDSDWDADRLAFMDVVVVVTALAEIINFPKIPLTVSVNEYIEIAKSYSSAKSAPFVNGLLGYIIRQLQDENILLKR